MKQQSNNWYSYVAGDPINNSDPSGYINYMRPGPPDHTYPQGAGGGGSGVAVACKPDPCALAKAAKAKAKRLAQSLGGCTGLTTPSEASIKLSAWLALAAARGVEMRVCFNGGHPGHIQQMSENIGAVRNCSERMVFGIFGH